MAPPMLMWGIDMAQRVFHLVGMDGTGARGLRKRIARSDVWRVMATWPPLHMGMDAWGRAHSWARSVCEPGHDVRRIASPVINASVTSLTNEALDAEAVGEAVTKPTMRLVPIQRVEPQDLQALHRVWERLIKAHSALVYEIRGLLNDTVWSCLQVAPSFVP
jgi:transposase